MPEASPSVLIIRLDAIGDAIALAPLLAGLRARAIPADVTIGPHSAGALGLRAARTIEVAPFAQRSSTPENLAAIARYSRELAARRYSHVLVATEDPGGYRLASAVGAPVRVGFSNGWGKPLKSLWTRGLLTQTQYRSAGSDGRGRHECAVLFGLASDLLGDSQPTRDLTQLRPMVLDREVARDGPVVMQITDKWERLGFAIEAVADAARRAAAIAAVRLIGSQHEAGYLERFERVAGLPVERFAAIAPWKETLAGARAAIAPDSGAIHVAGMTGTPTVAAFAARDFARQSSRWAPWAAPHRCIAGHPGWPHALETSLAELLSGTP